jgi:tRNA-dihydrouridine synthase B
MNWIDSLQSEGKPIVALAPMDGYCDSAFRATCKFVAPDIVVFSEFYSADGLHHNPILAERVLTHDPIEHPLVFQIFGNTPEMFLSAGKIIESYGAQGVDINMGCPVKKVVKCGYGSGLMIDRDRAMKIVNILAENLNIPVTVKTRLGWDGFEELIEFGQCLEQAGAKLLTVHGRTRQQAYTGDANWEPMFELQKALKIPVLGNGDCKNYEDGMRRIEKNSERGLAGFMIARWSLGNPWCFLPDNYDPTWQERIEVMTKHMEYMVSSKWENRACMEIRKHFTHYLHGFEGVREIRKKLAMITSVAETEIILKELGNMSVVTLETSD